MDYYTDTARIARIGIYNNIPGLDKVDFRNNLFAYIQEEQDLLDILTIDRQEQFEQTKDPQEIDADLNFISSQFGNFFADHTKLL